MFDVRPNEEEKLYAYQICFSTDLGHRGQFDGTKKNQLVGMLAQTVVADLFNTERPKGTGYDGGVDLVINKHSVDVKAMQRSVPVQDDFVHNLVASQFKYDCEYYIFTSLNTKNGFLTVCGVASKQTIKTKAKLFEKGETRRRSDGTTFQIQADMYEIKQSDLIQVNSLYELKESIV